ncbi:hypothetical protein BU23DRAFT_260309 [Bimuria novae-zelandiae CBS 107.79]|uniref:Zn(2)-C6 fungal-type domain-containing protein n=1 Tax=Bimuria novae-zelandiae CBS 107.79 TaxID=1447943 RepID=A0A6A5V0M0_9PLEO|nr:hypothetical protein BU23DRAFT_260309 [Bimuria novae-zelandiae CBS 107.79]
MVLTKMVAKLGEHKHVACARCRDRKVKCDGNKPGCKRCARNGTPCQYLARGRKQQTRMEWVQHLRTFSSQPARTDMKGSVGYPSSQPPVPRTPDARLQPLDSTLSPSNLNFYARSPSPFLLEHTPIETEAMPNVLPETPSNSFSSAVSAESWSASPAWTPSTEPQRFAFEPSASFFDTNFTSELLTTGGKGYFPVWPAVTRPHTPVSLASDSTGSWDGFAEM